MNIIILGSNGWFPSNNSQTSTLLIEYKNKLILLDAGSGVGNLNNHLDLIEKYEDVHIILSHYHLDHIIGLSYMSNFFLDHNIFIYGPGKPYYKGAMDILSKLTSEFFFSRPISKIGKTVSFNDYDLGGFFINGIEIRINLQEHSNFSFGIGIDGLIHYATDTRILNSTFNLSKDCKILFHECWSLDQASKTHTNLMEILEKQDQYDIEKIILIHKNPNWTNYDLTRINELIDGSNILLSYDNMTI